ncbi:MAG: ABC transporter ATP-binding protein [Planctomycetota bacterium]|nr:MAG: ABC transporter ATP-binding protein [Planctomycetota bacterium]
MIVVENLVKKFGSFTAVNDISLEVKTGEVVGFLGPNGAGKSTTMKVITCFLEATSGKVSVCGHDITKDSLKVRQIIGYLPESAPSYPDMTAMSFLKFIGQIRGFSGNKLTSHIDRVVEICELKPVLHKKIETLSKGFKQRTCLAQALIHDPQVLVLDEPTDGLDPNQKEVVRKLIREYGKEKTIILSTHILEEVEAVCDRCVIISNGNIVANQTPDELKKQSKYCGAVNLSMILDEESKIKAKSTLEDLQAVKNVDVISKNNQHKFVIFPQNNNNSIAGAVTETANNFGWKIQHLHTEQGRLDDVFKELTVTKS